MMKETNLEHYKEELKKIFNENFREPGNILFKIKKGLNNDESIKTDCYLSSYTDDILEWMAQPYKEPTLDDKEKEYLSAVIRPFRKEVDTISKFINWSDESQYIYISMKTNTYCTLPLFPKNTMYKSMEVGRHYSLKELGL